jgi:Ni/Fe-hydrogenase subunit HybB-like protein
VEVTLGLFLPIALLMKRKIRETAGGLYLASVLVLLGFITNRLNVSITGMEASAGMHYIPKWTEIAITGSIIAAGFAIFGLAVKHLPIFPEAGETGPITSHGFPAVPPVAPVGLAFPDARKA